MLQLHIPTAHTDKTSEQERTRVSPVSKEERAQSKNSFDDALAKENARKSVSKDKSGFGVADSSPEAREVKARNLGAFDASATNDAEVLSNAEDGFVLVADQGDVKDVVKRLDPERTFKGEIERQTTGDLTMADTDVDAKQVTEIDSPLPVEAPSEVKKPQTYYSAIELAVRVQQAPATKVEHVVPESAPKHSVEEALVEGLKATNVVLPATESSSATTGNGVRAEIINWASKIDFDGPKTINPEIMNVVQSSENKALLTADTAEVNATRKVFDTEALDSQVSLKAVELGMERGNQKLPKETALRQDRDLTDVRMSTSAESKQAVQPVATTGTAFSVNVRQVNPELSGPQTEVAGEVEGEIFDIGRVVQNEVKSNTVLQTAPVLRADPSMPVVRQMAEAMRQAASGDRLIEVALSPVELGRVRMSITPSEAGVVVNIMAERAETLDMMRRNIDELARSFEDLGYEGSTFSFDQEAPHQGENPENVGDWSITGESQSQEILLDTEALTPLPSVNLSADGVDIRL